MERRSPVARVRVSRHHKAKAQPDLYTDGAFRTFTPGLTTTEEYFCVGRRSNPNHWQNCPKVAHVQGYLGRTEISRRPGPMGWPASNNNHATYDYRRHFYPGTLSSSADFRIDCHGCWKTRLITRNDYLEQTWIQGSTVVAAPGETIDKARVAMWHYPAGGKQIRIKPVPARYTRGITVSILPSDVRSRR